jgi:hypothetical protein
MNSASDHSTITLDDSQGGAALSYVVCVEEYPDHGRKIEQNII